jgi:hypothetical protein
MQARLRPTSAIYSNVKLKHNMAGSSFYRFFFTLFVVLTLSLEFASCLDNGLALTPPS